MEEEIILLLDRFEDFKNSGEIKYFDTADILSLIEYFTDTDDTEDLKKVIELGYELYPNDTDFKLQICKTLVDYEDYTSALQLLKNDLYVKGKHDKETEFLMVECLLQLRKIREAGKFIREIEKECPYREELAAHIICISNDIDDFLPRTLKLIKKFRKIYPNNPTLKIELCYNLELQGRVKEAIDRCEEFLLKDPYSADLWFIEGRLFATFFEYGKAIEALDFALSCLTEENKYMRYLILYFKAHCYHINENYYKAIEIYEELLTMNDDDVSENEMSLVECYINTDEYEKAYEILKSMFHNINYEDILTVLRNYVLCCLETDRKEEAVEVLYETLIVFPNIIYEYVSKINILNINIFELTHENGEEKKDRKELIENYINNIINYN